MNKNIVNTKFLVSTALIAAIYVVMTLAIAPLSFGMIQIRISEVLMLMAFIDKKYAPGLVLGCFIANCFSPFGMLYSAQPAQRLLLWGLRNAAKHCSAQAFGLCFAMHSSALSCICSAVRFC